jgi:hypothetical protein
MEYDAWRRRTDDEYNRDVHLAWRIVNIWGRTKVKGRMPALRPMLRGLTREAAPTRAAQRAVLDVLSAQMGIPLVRRTLAHPTR